MKNIKVTLDFYTPLYIASDAIRTAWQSQGKSDWVFVTKCNQCRNNDRGYQQLSEEEQERIDDLDCTDYDEYKRLKPFDYNVGDGNASQCNKCDSLNTTSKKEPGDKDLALIHRVGNKFRHASTLEHITYNFDIQGISRALLQELARHRIASLTVKSSRYTLKELKDEKEFSFDMGTAKVYKRASKYMTLTGNGYVDNANVKALENLRAIIKLGVKNDEAKYCMPECYRTSLKWTVNMRSLQNFLSLRTDKGALKEIQLLAHKVFDALPEDHKYLLEEFVKPIKEKDK